MNTKQQKLRDELRLRLVKLQAESSSVQTQIARTNQLEYENVAAIYLWWRAASTVEGYLDELYEPTRVRRVFGENSGVLSFRRLLYLMYGNYGLDRDPLERKNKTLLCLHAEYEKNKNLYIKDGVAKLAGFIKSQGGIEGLINGKPSSQATKANTQATQVTSQQSQPQPLNTNQPIAFGAAMAAAFASGAATQASSSGQKVNSYVTYKPKAEINITDAMRYAALTKEAVAFYENQETKQAATINPPIATNKEGLAVAVVKRDAANYKVISASETLQGMREIMVHAYRRRLDAAPLPLRCLLEITKTQSLPSNLLKMYDKLAELSSQKREDNTKRKITRRVAYMAADNTFVLSPTYSKSGVVTTAKLKQKVFEGKVVDCFMPTRCRKQIEHRLLATSDFNLYKPSNTAVIPALNRSGLASHLMRLDNKAAEGDFFFCEFWPFEQSMGEACYQLLFADSYTKRGATKVVLPQSEFAKLAYDHINQWLMSYGDHITRPANAVLEFGYDSQGFTLGFDYVNKVFRNSIRSDFDCKLEGNTKSSATFLAKDLCLALHSMGELKIVGDVELYWTDKVVELKFETDIANYSLAIPTTNEKWRNDDAFTLFVPTFKDTAKLFASEGGEEDAVFEEALQNSNKALSDDEIEKIIGFVPDDYDEITEGLYDLDDDDDDLIDAEELRGDA